MVVGHDQGAGIANQRLFDDFAGVDGRLCHRTPEQLLAFD